MDNLGNQMVFKGEWKMNLYETDAEFMERFEHFAFEEVVHEDGQELDDETRLMAILATLIGCQGIDEFKVMLPNALDGGLSPIAIFGDGMKEAWKKGHINRWLAENCFGDYYTRTGLTLAQREMITFCFLAAQGGCEPQLTAHAKGNMNLGNDKEFLIRVVSQCLPYIGYPRSLNAIACVNKAAETDK